MHLSNIQKTSYDTSASKGFHDMDTIEGTLMAAGHNVSSLGGPGRRVADRIIEVLTPRWNHMQDSLRLLLAIGELIEAHEEIRAGHEPRQVYFKDGKPEGVPIELADAIIRIVDYAEARGIDLEYAIHTKQAYNAERPHMHGKQF